MATNDSGEPAEKKRKTDIGAVLGHMVNEISGVHAKLAKYEEKEFRKKWKILERGLRTPRFSIEKLAEVLKMILTKKKHEKILHGVVESLSFDEDKDTLKKNLEKICNLDGSRLASKQVIKIQMEKVCQKKKEN